MLMEVSLTNAWIIYVESCKKKNSMSHSKFRDRLVVACVGDCRQGPICGQGGGATTNRMTLTIRQRAETAWNDACDYSTARGKHMDFIVCSKRKVPGGRRETTLFCNTCVLQARLRVGTCVL